MSTLNDKGEMVFDTVEEAMSVLDYANICTLSSGNLNIHCGRCRYCLGAQPALRFLKEKLGMDA